MIYTVGHSNLSENDFCRLIEPLDVLLDIRSHPNSNKNPQFKIENLKKWVPAKSKKKYEWEPNLGGWDVRHEYLSDEMRRHGVDLAPYLKGFFPKGRINESLDQKGRPWWYIRGFYDYQWYMTLPEFFDAAEALIERGESENIGIMCCEALWWSCHRSMVCDYLSFRGAKSFHLQPKLTEHPADRLDRYESGVLLSWKHPVSARA